MLSGKVFEYLAAERPILAAVPPDGAAAELIRETGAGVVVGARRRRGHRGRARGLHARWRAGGSTARRSRPSGAAALAARTRVEELAELLWSLVRDER